MNQCSSQGSCVAGFCQCNAGFTGADCSAPLEVLTNGYTKDLQSNGIKWWYLTFEEGLQAGESFTLTLTSTNPIMDVYIS